MCTSHAAPVWSVCKGCGVKSLLGCGVYRSPGNQPVPMDMVTVVGEELDKLSPGGLVSVPWEWADQSL